MMKSVSVLAVVVSALAFACSSEPAAEPSEAPQDILDEPGTSDAVVPEGEDDPEAPDDGEAPDGEVPGGEATDGGASNPPAPPSPLQIWMSPTGNDSNDGLTAAKAVTSLARVQAILVATHGTKPWDRDVEVRIAPGRYVGQTVTWTHTSPTHKITFMPAANDKNRPVFDGCSSASNCVNNSFFRLPSSAGKKTNLAFEYLKVIRYRTAFSFEGNRNDAKKYNAGNRIYGCWLEDIGNAYAAGIQPSTAAVRLVNSDDNTIANNHFVDIVNRTSGALLHAIYVAHGSDRNTITSNRFVRNSGDPVRVRDFSNGNVITKNTFTKVGTAAGYTDWYCDHDVRTDCTKADPECPSWNNQFRDNALNGMFTCAPLPTFVYFQDDTAKGCTKPAGAVRLSTSGNTQNTALCFNE